MCSKTKNRLNKIMDKFNFFFCSHQALSTINKLIIKKILCFAFTVNTDSIVLKPRTELQRIFLA